MTHGSLYTGIGGWLLAARWAEIENIFTSEKDPFCNKVINKRFPEIPKENRHGDIRGTDFTKYAGRVDILSTSDPCQPFSFAGKRGGKADDRYLWPQTIRVIREIKPPYVVFENVPGLFSMENGETLEGICVSLENEGYTVEPPLIIPACGVGAWHRRDRLWVIAYTNGRRPQNRRPKTNRTLQAERDNWKTNTNERTEAKKSGGRNGVKDFSDTSIGRHGSQKGEISTGWNGVEYKDWWETEPNVGRVADGIPGRVDRLKSLGNSIVPQIAYIIFEAIKQVNES